MRDELAYPRALCISGRERPSWRSSSAEVALTVKRPRIDTPYSSPQWFSLAFGSCDVRCLALYSYSRWGTGPFPNTVVPFGFSRWSLLSFPQETHNRHTLRTKTETGRRCPSFALTCTGPSGLNPSVGTFFI